MIALVDYGAGNLTSVRKALAAIGADIWTPANPAELGRAEGIIVPGVGHFSSTARLGGAWREAVRESLAGAVPLLGICVGLQWLFDGSTEAPDVAGMGVFAGTCTRLDANTGSRSPAPDSRQPLKVPHVGWNSLRFARTTRLFEGVADGSQVYFTHSFAAPVGRATAATTTYGATFAAAVEEGLVSGVQFHPEKSGEVGLRILRNWLTVVSRSRGFGSDPGTWNCDVFPLR